MSYTVAARLQLVCGDWALVPREAISPDALMFATTAARLQCFNTSHLGSPGPRVQVSSGLAFLGPGGLADLSRSRDDQTYRTVGAHLAWNLVVACADTAWLPGCASGCARTRIASRTTPRTASPCGCPSRRSWSSISTLRRSACGPNTSCLGARARGCVRRAPRSAGPRARAAAIRQISREQLAEVVDAQCSRAARQSLCARRHRVVAARGVGRGRRDLSRAGTTRPMLLDPAREGTAPQLRALDGSTPRFFLTELRSLENDVRAGATCGRRPERRLLRA